MRELVLEFTKMEGAGNDFIVIDNRFYAFAPSELGRLAWTLCDRRRAVGADGLLAFEADESPEAHFRMRYYNADGSLGSMCGNGARCLVAYARSAGVLANPVKFSTDAGVIEAMMSDDAVRLFFPEPQSINLDTGIDGIDTAVTHGPVFVWTGTEHLVCRVNEVDSAPVATLGPQLRAHPALRSGANVNFVEVVSTEGAGSTEGQPTIVRSRTYEKGVEAETLACGTGALAIAAVGRAAGWWATPVTEIRMRGGTLMAGQQRDGRFFLEGPARAVYRGTVNLSPTDFSIRQFA